MLNCKLLAVATPFGWGVEVAPDEGVEVAPDEGVEVAPDEGVEVAPDEGVGVGVELLLVFDPLLSTA
jgi:hypothetical protein